MRRQRAAPNLTCCAGGQPLTRSINLPAACCSLQLCSAAGGVRWVSCAGTRPHARPGHQQRPVGPPRRNYRACVRAHQMALAAQRALWTTLLRDKLPFAELRRAFASMQAAEALAHGVYRRRARGGGSGCEGTWAARQRGSETVVQQARPPGCGRGRERGVCLARSPIQAPRPRPARPQTPHTRDPPVRPRVLERCPSNGRLLRAYGRFLEWVANDPGRAQRYYEVGPARRTRGRGGVGRGDGRAATAGGSAGGECGLGGARRRAVVPSALAACLSPPPSPSPVPGASSGRAWRLLGRGPCASPPSRQPRADRRPAPSTASRRPPRLGSRTAWWTS
jgi:hypothetical protein